MRPSSPSLARRATLRGAGLALALSGLAYAAPGDAGDPVAAARASAAPAGELEALRRGLLDLDSPFLSTRAAAVASLKDLGAASRPALREAFRTAPEARRTELARVLSSGADRTDLGLLLDALVVAKDPATISALRDALVDHAEESAAVIASRAERADGDEPLAWTELSGLLERARLEALFLSRKSLSGGTGSYDGQYAALRPWRKATLELCLAMLAETEVPRPGVFPVGTYRFLRPPPVLVEHEEVREMAANAIAELCTAEDTSLLDRLVGVHAALKEEMTLPGDENRVKRLIASGLDDVVLPTLVTLGRARRIELELRVREHESEDQYDDAAHLRLRMKQFEAAVELFQVQIRRMRQHVIPSYNLACAYARWSEAEAKNPEVAKRLREGALAALSTSVAYGYADWAWMEQDLDLQALRGMAGYRELVAGLKQKFPPPSTWLGATGTGRTGEVPDTPRSPGGGAAPVPTVWPPPSTPAMDGSPPAPSTPTAPK